MTAELQAIKTAFEDEGMSPEEIASDRELDLAAVKTALMQSSARYRKLEGKEDEQTDILNYSKEEQKRVQDVILDLALGADDPHLRFKAAAYVRDDAKGRKDVVKGIGGMNVNILNINKLMQQVRGAADSVKQKAINV